MTQNAAILDHLRSGATLTGLQALEMFGCLRLAGRVHDIRALGLLAPSEEIVSETVAVGRKKVARYSLRVREGQIGLGL